MNADAIIRQVIDAGGRLRTAHGRLFLTPGQPLSPDRISAIEAHKAAIIPLLESDHAGDTRRTAQDCRDLRSPAPDGRIQTVCQQPEGHTRGPGGRSQAAQAGADPVAEGPGTDHRASQGGIDADPLDGLQPYRFNLSGHTRLIWLAPGLTPEQAFSQARLLHPDASLDSPPGGWPCLADIPESSPPAAELLPPTTEPPNELICCGDCRQFQADAIGDGSGIGCCAAGQSGRYPREMHQCRLFEVGNRGCAGLNSD